MKEAPVAAVNAGTWIDWIYEIKDPTGKVCMKVPCKAYKDKWGVWVVGDEMNRISKLADDLFRNGKPY